MSEHERAAFDRAHAAAIAHVALEVRRGEGIVKEEIESYLDFMGAGGWDVFAPVERACLENRRPSWRVKAHYAEAASAYALTLYLDVSVDWRTLRALEVFAKPGGEGGKQSMLERWLDDVAPLVSLCLQRGATPEEIARVIGQATQAPAEVEAAVRDRGGRLEIELAVPVGLTSTGTARLAAVPCSSPAAAFVAAVHAVQHWIDEAPGPLREALRTALKPGRRQSPGNNEKGDVR